MRFFDTSGEWNGLFWWRKLRRLVLAKIAVKGLLFADWLRRRATKVYDLWTRCVNEEVAK
jgi:hypothetical protein